jgi:hypothetical protein
MREAEWRSALARSGRTGLYRSLEKQLSPELVERLLRDRWDLERYGWLVTIVRRGDDHGFVVEGTDEQGRFGIYFLEGYPELAPAVFHDSERLGIFGICACMSATLGSWHAKASLDYVLVECRFAASCSHLKADFGRVMQPPVLQPHAATSERA